MTTSVAPEDRLRTAIDDSLTRRSAAAAVVAGGHVWTYADLARLLPSFRRRQDIVRVSDRSVDDVAHVTAALLADRPFQFVSPGTSAAEDAEAAARRALAERPSPTKAAYLIRSSGTVSGGSTLHMTTRRSLQLYLDGVLDRIQAAPGHSFAVCTPLWYDLSYTSLFGALAVGGCLHLLPASVCASRRQTNDYFRLSRVDYLKITPTLFSALFTGASLPAAGVIFGGEVLPWWLVVRVRGCGGRIPRLFNHYGPAETTIGVCAGEVPPHRGDTESVPVGTALRHVTAAVDGDDQVGELMLSGPQVAENLGTVPYRTRDRVRALPGGGYEFLGRLDRKVKIRGELVDLAEVERLVRLLPGVARVVARPLGGDISEQLLLTVSPEEEGALGHMDVYRHLERHRHTSLCQSVVRIRTSGDIHESGKSR